MNKVDFVKLVSSIKQAGKIKRGEMKASCKTTPLDPGSLDPQFLAIIERSRARIKKEGGISADEMRRRLKSKS